MKVKRHFWQFGVHKVNNGTQIYFWKDVWLDGVPFNEQYVLLYNIVSNNHATVVEVLASSSLNVSFRRAVVGVKLSQWVAVVHRVSGV